MKTHLIIITWILLSNASVVGATTDLCVRIGFNQFCGSAELNNLYLKNKIDFAGAQKAEADRKMKKLKNDAVSIVELGSETEPSKKWNQHVQKMYDTLSYEYLSFSLLSVFEKTDRPIADMIKAMKAEPALVTINLNDKEKFVKIDQQMVSYVCSKYMPYAEGSDCGKLITGNLSESIDPDDEDGQMLYLVGLSVWISQKFFKDFGSYVKSTPRKVYLIKGKGTISPSVDRMASVYIPEELLSNKPNLDLVFLHESAHIAFFNWAYVQSKAMTTFFNYAIAKGGSNLNEDDRKALEEFESAIPKMLQSIDNGLELAVDAYVLQSLIGRPMERQNYIKMIDSLDIKYIERKEALNLLNQFFNETDDPKLPLAMALGLLSQRPDFIPSLPLKQQIIVHKYLETRNRLASASQTSFMAPYLAKEYGIDPGSFEDILLNLYKVFREFVIRIPVKGGASEK